MQRLPPISAGTGWSSAIRRRRPACCGRTAATPCSAWTAPPTSPPSMQRRRRRRPSRQGRRRDRAQCRPAVRPARRRLVELSDVQAAGRRGLAARAARSCRLPRRGADAGAQLAGKRLSIGNIACAVGAVGAACRARPGRCVLRADRQGHRLCAGGGRRADRQGRRTQPARRLRGADQGARRRHPHRRRRCLDRPGRRPRDRRAAGFGRTDFREEERDLLGHADAALRPAARRREAARAIPKPSRTIATAKAISRSTTRWTSRRHGAAQGLARSRCCI